MMKKTMMILLLVVMTACSGSFTRIPEADKTLRMSADIAGLTQAQIIQKTQTWMEKEFTAYLNPILSDDRDEGKIIGRGQIAYPCSWVGCISKENWKVAFDMYVKSADGSMESLFRNIQLLSPPSGASSGMTSPVWSKRDMDAIRPELVKLNQSLIRFLSIQQ